jgi:hypothetical protein
MPRAFTESLSSFGVHMRRPVTAVVLIAITVSASIASAQVPATIAPATEQITAAVLPLPAELRAGATVLGYSAAGRLVPLRPGSNDMICLADDPRQADRFHVACYHKALEPFMARGRALRAEGVQGDQIDSVRFRELRAGRLALPRGQWALYSLSGGATAFDRATGTAPTARPLFVMYMPFATAQSTGLSTQPGRGPWLMLPGTPKAHLMITPTM